MLYNCQLEKDSQKNILQIQRFYGATPMSKLNNSSPRPARRPASFLQPSLGARASPRVLGAARRALTLGTAGTVETWRGPARRRPNLISRGSTLARGTAHHGVIMWSERINENI